MNRNRAKILTATGVACSFSALLLIVSNLTEATRVPTVILPALFIAGIVLIILSLAYYTEI